MCLISLQGKLNCKYVVGFYYSPKPQRAALRERWPASTEDNLARLEDAGLPYDRQIPKCINCGGKQTSVPNEENRWQKSLTRTNKEWVTFRAAARKSVPSANESR